MRKVIAATGVVVAAGLVIGLPLWLGSVATSALEQQTKQLEQLSPHFKLVKQETTHGLFSSTHDATVQLGCLPAETPGAKRRPLELSFHSVVHHGPLPGLQTLAAATVDSELRTPSALPALQKMIGKQPLLRVHSEVSFARKLASAFQIAGLSWSDPAQGGFSSKPLLGTVLGDAQPGDQDTSYVLDLPGAELNMHGPDGAALQIKLGRVLAESALGKRVDKLWLRPGKTDGFISAIDLTSSMPAGGGAAYKSRGHWDGLKFGSEATLEQGLWTSTYGFTTRGKINDFEIQKIELRGSLKRLDAASYQRVLDAMFASSLSCDPNAPQSSLEALLPALQKELLALLGHDPELGLDKLELQIGAERALLSYSVGSQGVSAADAATPMLTLLGNKGFARAKLQIHLGLVELLANKIANYDSGPSTQTPLARTSPLVLSFVDKFVQKGYLERAGDQLRVSAAFEAGQVLLNGKPAGLPTLGTLLAP